MDYKKIFFKTILIVFCISLGVFGTLTYQRFTGPKQTVTISGSGEIEAPVNQATINILVRNTAATYALALEANQKDVASLKNSLIELGIPESRITQSSFQPPYYRYGQDEQAVESQSMEMMRPIIVPDNKYTVTANLTVILDSIKNIENVYQIINDNPNTQINNTDYSLTNQKEWETKAKEEALKDARSQAESIAKINKLRVGRLVSITDDNVPQLYAEDQDLMYKESASISNEATARIEQVNYSEQTVKIYASYTAVYELY